MTGGKISIEVGLTGDGTPAERALAIAVCAVISLIRKYEKNPEERRKLALAYGRVMSDYINDPEWRGHEL